MGLAVVLIVVAALGLRQTYSKRTLQRMRDAARLGGSERERLAIRNARLVLGLLVVALMVELPVAYAYWTDEELLPWLFASVAVTVMFAVVFAVILVRAQFGSKARQR